MLQELSLLKHWVQAMLINMRTNMGGGKDLQREQWLMQQKAALVASNNAQRAEELEAAKEQRKVRVAGCPSPAFGSQCNAHAASGSQQQCDACGGAGGGEGAAQGVRC